MKRLRLLLLASGRGSHVVNLVAATRGGRIDGVVTRVVCDRPEAPVLGKAQALDVPTTLLEPVAPGARLPEAAEEQLLGIARADEAGLIALCGFMRLLSAEVLERLALPVLNVHPSLLPSFRGLHAQRQAIEAGVRVTGVTVHFVDSGMDTGPILLQAALPIHPDETEESLSQRLLPLEHRLYAEAVRLYAMGAVRREGRRVTIRPGAVSDWLAPGAEGGN
ncbi:MAG TPA: phosphoribosylglycinamide formyltransferase [Candidatus Eisenbacteria bacterium]|jgi:phosphoribosylglycinamide formyltransferase-1